MELEIKNLSKTYNNGTKALDAISLNITSGMFGLLGPNGAGKSTLMRTLATLQKVDSGSVKVDKIDIFKNEFEIRKMLGYLPQDFGVFPEMSAEEMLDYIASLKGISNRRMRKESVKYLLDRTNLFNVRKNKLGTFSGGMKQRFGIAQALLGDPKIIIVDEPTAGLDPEERNRFHNLLSEISGDKIVILSTHIVDDVRVLCSKMAILHRGKVCFSGSPQESISDLQGKIWEKEINRNEIEEYNNNYKIIISRMLAGKIVIHVLSAKNPGNGFKSVTPDLEDVYFTIIKNGKDNTEGGSADV
ncbi:MAG: ABC transporter ATP-binding protein [Acidobacteria bacterium]|nr:ABC transporter ATP-binding protein [Acidobacteriota bacterium]